MKTFVPLHQMAAIAGTVHLQRRVCGRPTCRCRRDEPHVGHYFFWRQSGRLRKRYIPRDEVEVVRAACEERRRRERARRAALRAARVSWRALAASVREVERRDG